jgi:hypothetical protein
MLASEHCWGVSDAADRVWSLVAGYSPVEKAGERPLMAMQAFFDDSYDDAVYVLAGHVATVENWAAFSVEWQKLLKPFGTLRMSDGVYHFKMSEMAANPERMARLAPFYRLIEEYVALSVSVWFRPRDLIRAFNRLQVPNRPLAFLPSVRHFHVAFYGLLENLVGASAEIEEVRSLLDLPIDFYFDEQSERKPIIESWRDYVERQGSTFRDFVRGDPKFEKDHEFLPLQAADFWAWWVREWHAAGTPEQMHMPDFGPFAAKRKGHVKADIELTEETMISVFKKSIRAQLEPDERIYDITFTLNGDRLF